MKKELKVIIPLFLIGLLVSVNISQASFGVTAGDSYVYDIVHATQEITVGTNSGSGNGYIIDGQSFTDGTSINCNVTAVGVDVEYNKQAGTAIESGSRLI